MKYINYDFSEFEKIMSSLKLDSSNIACKRLLVELNKFFKGSTCNSVTVSDNDKLFFGMCVVPFISNSDTSKIILGHTPINKRVSQYHIDIDSKLLTLNLSNRELVAILLHEVGHIVNTSDPLTNTQDAVSVYMSSMNDNIDIQGLNDNIPLFIFAIQDTVYVMTSLFRKKDEEVLADEFVVYCGYGKELESALNKIVSKNSLVNNNIDNKLLTLQWSLRLYKSVKMKRVHAISTLTDAIELSGSKSQNRRMTTLVDFFKSGKSRSSMNEEVTLFRKTKSLYTKMKYNNMKNIESEFFEITLKVKNVDEHDDALAIMRAINTNMSIIEDFINSNNLQDKEGDKWFDLLNRYREQRDILSKKTTVDEKFYGLFVQMPNIKSRYEV